MGEAKTTEAFEGRGLKPAAWLPSSYPWTTVAWKERRAAGEGGGRNTPSRC
jgi:hypothetical protein